ASGGSLRTAGRRARVCAEGRGLAVVRKLRVARVPEVARTAPETRRDQREPGALRAGPGSVRWFREWRRRNAGNYASGASARAPGVPALPSTPCGVPASKTDRL